MKSDYWPGALPTISSLVHGSALREWQFLMFQAPGTSQGKYITVLDEIAHLNDRVTKLINILTLVCVQYFPSRPFRIPKLTGHTSTVPATSSSFFIIKLKKIVSIVTVDVRLVGRVL